MSKWDDKLLQLTKDLNHIIVRYNLPISCFVEGTNVRNREICLKFLEDLKDERIIPNVKEHFHGTTKSYNTIKIFDYNKLKENATFFNKNEVYNKNIKNLIEDFYDFCRVLNEEI